MLLRTFFSMLLLAGLFALPSCKKDDDSKLNCDNPLFNAPQYEFEVIHATVDGVEVSDTVSDCETQHYSGNLSTGTPESIGFTTVWDKRNSSFGGIELELRITSEQPIRDEDDAYALLEPREIAYMVYDYAALPGARFNVKYIDSPHQDFNHYSHMAHNAGSTFTIISRSPIYYSPFLKPYTTIEAVFCCYLEGTAGHTVTFSGNLSARVCLDF